MMELFHDTSQLCSKIATRQYSSSFSSAVQLLHPDLRSHIFNIYGFVRFADEIVDTFHDHDKEGLLAEFKRDTWLALEREISLNPILHSFQGTVRRFNIPLPLIHSFFQSMERDLHATAYDDEGYKEYIYGSAEAVGLMCLCVFCEGDTGLQEQLKPHARSLGAAFQKVNFLRDLKADRDLLQRSYFPGVDLRNFTASDKALIEADIQKDFDHAFKGVSQLPLKARFGVFVAYRYYLSLFHKIRRMQPVTILEGRVRIPGYAKSLIVFLVFCRYATSRSGR